MKGPCTCRGAGEIQQEANRGTAVELPPACRKGLRKAPGPLPSWKNTSWLGADNSGCSNHSLPPQYFLPAQNHSCFKVQSMVLASPGRPGPA